MTPQIIEIALTGATAIQTTRCQSIILQLFESGFFDVRNGKAIIHFDHEANMQQIEYDFIKWRKKSQQVSNAPVYNTIEAKATK